MANTDCLGKNQKAVLDYIVNNNGWFEYCGFTILNSQYQTMLVIKKLLKRKLIKIVVDDLTIKYVQN